MIQISRSRHYSTLNISQMPSDRAIVTIERQHEVIGALSNGDIFNDLDGPLTEVEYLEKRRVGTPTKLLYVAH